LIGLIGLIGLIDSTSDETPDVFAADRPRRRGIRRALPERADLSPEDTP
jgi:hypothetical protein